MLGWYSQQCYIVTLLQHYNVCITLHSYYAGNSWAPRTSAHGVKRNPTERMKWMHWDKIFNRLYIAGTFRFNLMAFIFGSYLRSSRSVYGSVTHNSLTFDHEPEYLLCVGCGKYDGCCSVELDLIFTPVDKSVLSVSVSIPDLLHSVSAVLAGDVSLGCGMSLTDTMGWTLRTYPPATLRAKQIVAKAKMTNGWRPQAKIVFLSKEILSQNWEHNRQKCSPRFWFLKNLTQTTRQYGDTGRVASVLISRSLPAVRAAVPICNVSPCTVQCLVCPGHSSSSHILTVDFQLDPVTHTYPPGTGTLWL